MSAVHPTENAI